MRVDKNQSFRKNEQILYKEIDGAGVLIDPYRRTLMRLNPAASQIWQLLDGQHSCAVIIEALKAEFEAGARKIEKDVTDFIKELHKREMIR